MSKSKSKKVCSWCGTHINIKDDLIVTIEDAAHEIHHFHPDCAAKMRRFMRERV